jgi:large subunit ribosomal protein L28
MRQCELTGKRQLVGYRVSHAHNKTKMRQLPNVQKKRIWVQERLRFVTLTLSTRAIRTIHRVGLKETCKAYGVDYDRLLVQKLGEA